MLKQWIMSGIAMAALAGACFAETDDAAKFFKLDFVVKEVEAGKVLSARTYTMTAATGRTAPTSSIRTGSKMPIPTGDGGHQFTFIDVGVSLDCRDVKEVPSGLSMVVTADISSVPQESMGPGGPIVRQNRWNSSVVVPLRKPTVVFTSDDVSTKHQMQLEILATPIN